VTYHYWTVRFVPDVSRGEFTNVGVVVGRDGGDWAVRLDQRFVRNHGDLSSDLRELASWSRHFERQVNGLASPRLDGRAPSTFGQMEHWRRRQANAVQLGEPMPVLTASAAEGVRLLYPVLVERVTSGRRGTYDRRSLRSRVQKFLVQDQGFVRGRDLFASADFTVGRQHGTFDLVRTSDRGPRITNVWAFNVLSLSALERDLQSWSYLVGRLRREGARTELTDGGYEALDRDVPIDVVVDVPVRGAGSGDRRRDIFEAAREAWTENGVAEHTVESFEDGLRESRALQRG